MEEYSKLAYGIVAFAIIAVIGIVVIGGLQVSLFQTTVVTPTSEFVLSDNATSTTLSNVPVESIDSATAVNNSWLEFDGTDYIGITKPLIQINAINFSVCFWENATDVYSKQIFKFGAGDTSKLYIAHRPDLAGYIKLAISNATGIADRFTFTNTYNTSMYIGEWKQYCFTSNDTTVDFYVDGAFNISKGSAIDWGTGVTNFTLTKIGEISSGISGSLDEIRIYNQTLTPVEIAEIYASGLKENNSITSDGLIGWYPFNENQGLTAYDLSLNGNDGTNNGATYQDDGATSSLTEDTDYTLSGDTFTLINDDYAYNQLNISYNYNLNVTSEGYDTAGFFTTQITDLTGWMPAVIAIIMGTLFLSYFMGRRRD